MVSKARAPRLVGKEESQEEEENRKKEEEKKKSKDQGMFVIGSNVFWIPRALVRRIDAPLV